MRIGIVTHYMPPHMGGIERVAEVLADAYRARGHDTRWVASRVPAAAPAEEEGRRRVACWNGPERALGVPMPVWGPSGWRAVRDLAGWADVLHVHDCLYPGSVAAVLARRRGGAPVLLSQHVGLVPYRSRILVALQRLAYATLGRAVLRRADALVLATAGAAAFVPALLGGRPPDARLIPNGVDTRRFAPTDAAGGRRARLALGAPADGPLALFAGRLVGKKGLPLALAAAAAAGVPLLVIGEGPLASTVAAAGGRAIWHRAVDPERMPLAYHAADCLLLPSQGEGLPLVVQEAMASGLPAIVSADEPYVAELAAAGACLAAPREPGALAARVRAVLAGEATETAARGRAHALEHWSAAAMAERYLEALAALAAPGRVPR